MRADLQAVHPRERRRASELLPVAHGKNSSHKEVLVITQPYVSIGETESPMPEGTLCHISPKSLQEKEG